LQLIGKNNYWRQGKKKGGRKSCALETESNEKKRKKRKGELRGCIGKRSDEGLPAIGNDGPSRRERKVRRPFRYTMRKKVQVARGII